ncbi:trypsin-like peptidase domain-containing protein, partial [Myxococcota bacterium]|nr:trypsin-like peptidase domain-containing protein [Myxococcota bacterium]
MRPRLNLALGALLGVALTLGALGLRGPLGHEGLSDGESRDIALFAAASPAVVFITNIALYKRPFQLDPDALPQGAGTGLIWDERGHIVTNFHVIAHADALRVTLADQRDVPAKIIGVAPNQDLAVLKIDLTDLPPPLRVGRSDDLQVGQHVLAIGNPFGLDRSLTTGVVSALDRSIQAMSGRMIQGVIQTDASINPGNSGGPLLDSAGRLIGVNTAIKSPSGASAGIGFAVPVDTLKRVIPQLIKHGRLTRPQLGVRAAHAAISRRIGLEGVLLLEVTPGGLADQLGLKGTRRGRSGRLILGDVLLALNGVPLRNGEDLIAALEGHVP